jgi:integrase
MTVSAVLDSAGRRRSPATLPGYHAGRPPRNKGQRYPADPPTVEEIIAVMRQTIDDRHGWRLRALIVVLWRSGLRVQEALVLTERDLDPRRGAVLVRNGKGGRRREIGMDAWGWEQLRPWLAARVDFPVGPLFCILDGPTRGRAWSGAGLRVELRRLAAQAGPVRAAPAAPRARARTRARGGGAEHHPTPAWRVNAKALSAYMGHSSITVTLDRYGHLMPGHEGEAAAMLTAYLERQSRG